MSKIARKVMKIFGSSAGPTQIGVYGSLAAAAPAYSTDPAVIQSLSNYLGGWFSAIIGNNSPAIEDMNALFYLMAYQLAYGFQAGVAEWDASTTYYVGSIANDGNGALYVSTFNGNINNAVTDNSKWLPLIPGPIAPTFQKFITPGSSTYVPTCIFNVVSANATIGDTYTNNGQTFTIQKTISSGIQLIAIGTGSPSASGTLTRTSGSGDSTISFVKVIRPLSLKVTVIGAGGGGAGGGANADGSPGTDGTASSFGTSLLVANGGPGGAPGGSSVAIPGGTASLGGALGIAIQGAGSNFGMLIAGSSIITGAPGASSPLGGGGYAGTLNPGNGGNASANTGSGGGGGGQDTTSQGNGGGGGAAGGYVVALITLIMNYAVVVGAKGVGGAIGGGLNPSSGGDGADGIILVEESYQ